MTNFGDAVGEITAIGTMAVEGIIKISVKANFEQAKATTAAQNSSKLAEAQIQGLIEKYDRQAELQRQIRDDETKTFEERVAANKKLGEILNEQETEMLALAKTNPEWLGFAMEGYIFASIIFWIICYAMSKYSYNLEAKYKTER